MFFHIFKYRIRSLLRSKVILFWCLVYPILLGLLFYAGFGSSINDSPSLEPIAVCVVTETDSETNTTFKEVFNDVSYDSGGKMFDVTFTDAGKALSLLEDGKASGIITLGDDITIKVASEGINESIIKQFCDSYKRQVHVITDIMKTGADPSKALAELSKDSFPIEQVSLGGEQYDGSTQYYYALIAMACMFGSFTGVVIGDDVQTKGSVKGARKAVSSIHRFKLIIGDMLAAFAINFVEVSIVSLFVHFVLGIRVISDAALFFPILFFGTMIGVCVGQFFSCISGGRQGLKIGLSIAFSLMSSFLAGLMFGDMKYIISKNLPLLGRINPASLITDAFYSLTVYSDHGRYLTNLVILAVEAAVIVTCSFIAVRRSRHASI